MLLERFGLPFEVCSPAIDEAGLPGEEPAALAARLAGEKADVVARRHPQAVVIGSDQVAVFDGRIIGKPGSMAAARRQLASFSGQQVVFLSAVAVRCAEREFRFDTIVPTEVVFRTLSPAEIRRYVERDKPVDCAGAFKSEQSGTTLLRSMRSDDPTAIIGLPLISVAEALRQAGFALP